MIEEDVPAKLKDLSTQPAMVPQSSMARSQGFAICGQQSGMASVMDMSLVMDMSARCGDFELTPAPAAAGSIATDRATRSARMVRPLRMGSGLYENRFLSLTVKWRFRETPRTFGQKHFAMN